ncbi:MAG: PTS sugar transporter subunit IIA [Phycisphaerales bacterium]|nr:PTS sugar transporter subunit IIA [Phycisphaerales bacterium]
MNILDIISVDCIKVPLQATDKKAAIFELVDLLASSGKVDDVAGLRDAVWSREQTRTTGIGHGLAIPHGKCVGIPRLAMAIGRPEKPMDFAAIDGKPVQLIILLASPIDRTSDHIQALARISKIMHSESFRERVYRAGTAEDVFALLREAEKAG